MEKESLNDYNPKDGLKEVYHGALPCQSSIYASCTIPKQNGVRPARILLSPLLKNFNVYSCANAPKGQLIWKYPFDVFKSIKKPTKFLLRISALDSKKR